VPNVACCRAPGTAGSCSCVSLVRIGLFDAPPDSDSGDCVGDISGCDCGAGDVDADEEADDDVVDDIPCVICCNCASVSASISAADFPCCSETETTGVAF
jgi:hypothetical protein